MANLDQFWLPNIHSFTNTNFYHFIPAETLKTLHIKNDKDLLTKMSTDLSAHIVHSHFGHIGWRDKGVAKKTNAKHVVSFYGFDVNYLPVIDPVWSKRYCELFREVDCVLCEGSFMAQDLVDRGCPPDKVLLQHLGICVDKIRFEPRRWNHTEALKVLVVASFQEKKGIPYALEALGRLQKDVDLMITIIGDANDEERSQLEKKNILNTIEKYRLSDKTRLLSYQPYNVLFDEAYNHDIFLSPSVTSSDGDTEGGLPVTILEMAATGMIIVSTRHCDIPEAIHHGSMGLLTEERDVDGIIHNIKWLLDNPDKWNEMTIRCRRHIEEEYDVQKQAIRLAKIYRELL
jgi:colanic acid/amylovoran biosynthesis glycosyltransferase